MKIGKRSGLKCSICCKHINEAQKLSRNGQVPIADGIRSDGSKALERVIDHLNSEAHSTAIRFDEATDLWKSRSHKHPWIRLLKNYEVDTVSSLIELAVDVHNDSKQLTLSANSWPSRSLAHMHSANQIAVYRSDGLDSDLCSVYD